MGNVCLFDCLFVCFFLFVCVGGGVVVSDFSLDRILEMNMFPLENDASIDSRKSF